MPGGRGFKSCLDEQRYTFRDRIITFAHRADRKSRPNADKGVRRSQGSYEASGTLFERRHALLFARRAAFDVHAAAHELPAGPQLTVFRTLGDDPR